MRARIFLMIAGFLLVFGMAGCVFDDEKVSAVKNGHLSDYPAVTVGEAFDSFFASPEWKSFKSDKGKNIVEFTGKCRYQDVDVTAKMQFVVSGNKAFEIDFFSLNDIPQNKLLLAGLMGKVFEKAEKKKTEETNKKTQATSNSSNSTTNMQAAQTLLYGNWGVYATDWVKYKFNGQNLRIVNVETVEPNGESKIWVDTFDSTSNKWSNSYCKTLLTVSYNEKSKKHEMNIVRKANDNSSVISDADTKKRFESFA